MVAALTKAKDRHFANVSVINTIFHNFLNVLTLNRTYVFTVCMLVYVCVCTSCVWAAISAGLSLAVPARLS